MNTTEAIILSKHSKSCCLYW